MGSAHKKKSKQTTLQSLKLRIQNLQIEIKISVWGQNNSEHDNPHTCSLKQTVWISCERILAFVNRTEVLLL